RNSLDSAGDMLFDGCPAESHMHSDLVISEPGLAAEGPGFPLPVRPKSDRLLQQFILLLEDQQHLRPIRLLPEQLIETAAVALGLPELAVSLTEFIPGDSK